MTDGPEAASAEGADWRQARRYQPADPADQAVLDDLERQLSGLRFIDTPVWAFDAERCQCLWANPSGLEIWKAASVTELQQRDIASTQSEAVYTLLNDYLRRVEAGESIAVWVTLDPRGTTRRFYQSHHLLTLLDGRKILLIEAQAEPPAEELLAFASSYALTIGLYEMDGQLVSGNPAFRQLAESHPLDDLNALIPREAGLADWPSRIAEHAELVFETSLNTPRGQGLFRGELRRVFTQQRRARAILTLYDLTEQRFRESELALQENLKRTERLLDSAEVATFLWDVEHQQLRVDKRWWRMLGYSPDAFPLTLEAWAAMLHPEDAGWLDAAVRKVLAGEQENWNNEYRIRAADGSWRWILDRGMVTRRAADGQPLELGGIHLDIHDRKLAAEAQAASEMRQRALLGALPDLLAIHDLDGNFVDLHAAHPEQWHLPPGPVVGLHISQTLPPEQAARFGPAQELVLASGKLIQGEYQIPDPAGGASYREFRMVPYGPAHTLTLIRDVTDRHRAEEAREQVMKQLQQTQKMEAMGQLTGGVAHDFNNILASILGYTWLTSQHPLVAAEPKITEYLNVITAAGERGRDLVQKMLTFSRRSGVAPVDPVNAVQAVSDAYRMLRPMIPSHIGMSLQLPAAACMLPVDPTDLQQVLVNLVANSRDALGESGEISVGVEPVLLNEHYCASCHQRIEGHFLGLAVEDTGGGIAPAALDRIFDPFYTTKEVGAGTGIGLSVVDGIVHRYGGHVLVDSVVGDGTRIEILLPIPAESTHATTPAAAGDRESAPPGVMVVDDEAWVGQLLRELLEEDGYAVTVFTTGRAALDGLANAGGCGLVITDLSLPDMSGLELARAIRTRMPALPVALCTGAGELPAQQELQAAGIAQVLPKPIPMNDLKALVRGVMGPAVAVAPI